MKKFIISLILILTMQAVHAGDDMFKNELLKMDIYKTSDGKVKVTLYTTKPYNETMTVNAKPNYKYVIYMPETSNLLSAKPTMPTGLISDVDVKTQPYNGQPGKGYTKITFSATQNVEIVPQIQVLAPSTKITDKEYNELIAEAKKPIARPKPIIAPPVVVKSKQNVIKPNITKPEPVKEIVKPVLQKPVETPTPVVVQEPAQQSIQESAEIITEEPQQEIVQEEQVVEQAEKLIAPEKKPLINRHLVFVLGIILIPILLILLLLKGARKTIAKFKQQKQAFVENLNEQPAPEPETFQEIIEDEDMDWKEKYESYVNTAEEIKEETVIAPSNEDLDELFNEPEEETKEEDDIFEEYEEEWIETEQEPSEVTFEDLFEEEEIISEPAISIEPETPDDKENVFEFQSTTEEAEEEIIEQIEEEESVEVPEHEEPFILKSQYNIDDNKGFYLVDIEDETALIGYIDEEIFVLKKFDRQINAPLQVRSLDYAGSPESAVSGQHTGSLPSALPQIHQENTYMVKTGAFKALIQVNSNEIKTLIEL